jgi:hypothetical protein
VLHWYSWLIWAVNATLQWGLLALVFWKRGWRQHPAFSAYVTFSSCKTTGLILVMTFAERRYFIINWSARLVALPLLIAVLLEVFAAVFRPYSTLPKGTLRWFRIAFVSLVLLTTAAAVCFPGPTPRNLVNTVLLLNRCASIIFCGAFGFTALFSSYFGIPWQQRTYGIGVGFLLFMSVDLFTASLTTIYGFKTGMLIGNISMLSYTMALITWITYFAKADVPSRTPTLEQMRRLQKALDYSAKKVESFRGTS